MAQPARYLFDLDFSAPPEPEIEEVVEEVIEEEPPEPMITVAEHEQLIETIRQQAYEQGLAEGRAEREKSAAEQNVALQKTILDEIAMVYTEVGDLMARLERDASQLAFGFASRFAEKLVAQEPREEIQALLHQVLAPLRDTPHLTIRVHDSLAEDIKKSTQEQGKELGFAGSILVIGDDTVALGDCEVEWADGGIGRNMRAAIHQVEDLLEQHFSHIPQDMDDTDEAEQPNGDDETEQAQQSASPTSEQLPEQPQEQSDEPQIQSPEQEQTAEDPEANQASDSDLAPQDSMQGQEPDASPSKEPPLAAMDESQPHLAQGEPQ